MREYRAVMELWRRTVEAVGTLDFTEAVKHTVGRCTFTVSRPVLKAPMVSALEATI
jgi:hypothetical protein